MIPIFKPSLGKEELREVKQTFRSNWIGGGPKAIKFEEEFKKYIGCKTAISVNSCTAALHLCLLALDIKEGDEVLIPAITFASTGHAVLFCKATPILVDVDPKTLQMNVEDLKRKITAKTKAIIPVHYGGILCDVDSIISIAKEKKLYVIEDAANCCGAEYKGIKIGNLDSDFTCFSFEAKKNMATGDGGMITTNKEGEIINKIKRLRWVGMDKDTAKRFGETSYPWEYDILDLGFKYNMNDITASIGLIQLQKLDEMNKKRNKIVTKYNAAFKDKDIFTTIKEVENNKNAYWLYILRLNKHNRDDLLKHLLKYQISSNTSFKPLNLFTYYKNYYESKGINPSCPIAEEEWSKLIVLPLFPTLKNKEVSYIIKTVKEYCNDTKI
jgi:perosamine synthetase